MDSNDIVALESLKEFDEPMHECPLCHNRFKRHDMEFTRDCHGIVFRLVCYNCYDKAMENGYDGQYYTEADECIYDY